MDHASNSLHCLVQTTALQRPPADLTLECPSHTAPLTRHKQAFILLGGARHPRRAVLRTQRRSSYIKHQSNTLSRHDVPPARFQPTYFNRVAHRLARPGQPHKPTMHTSTQQIALTFHRSKARSPTGHASGRSKYGAKEPMLPEGGNATTVPFCAFFDAAAGGCVKGGLKQ